MSKPAGRRQRFGRSACIAARPAMPVRTAQSSWQQRRGMAAKTRRSATVRGRIRRQRLSRALSLRPSGISLLLHLRGANLAEILPTALKCRQAGQLLYATALWHYSSSWVPLLTASSFLPVHAGHAMQESQHLEGGLPAEQSVQKLCLQFVFAAL